MGGSCSQARPVRAKTPKAGGKSRSLRPRSAGSSGAIGGAGANRDGERGSGMICLNGAAARCVSTGDKIIIMAYGQYEPEEAKSHKPSVVFVDEKNRISRISCYEKHGQLG